MSTPQSMPSADIVFDTLFAYQRSAALKSALDLDLFTAIHSGEHLAEELVALEMSAAELARQLKVPTKRVTEILNGQRAITGDTALRLRSFVRHEPAVLAESSKPVRALVGRRKKREGDQEAANVEASRRS